MKVNKPAGFWLRLLSRIIDLLIVLIVISITMYLSVQKRNGRYYFSREWLFYLWTIASACLMAFFTTLLPIITNGKSVGNMITKTKIVSEEKISRSVFYRELFFGLAWTTIILLFTIILTPKILMGVITNDNTKIKLSSADQFRFAFVNTVSGIVIFAQFIFAISILIKKGGNSAIDSLSKSNVVRINKYIKLPKEEKEIKIEPRLIENNPVEWVEEK